MRHLDAWAEVPPKDFYWTFDSENVEASTGVTETSEYVSVVLPASIDIFDTKSRPPALLPYSKVAVFRVLFAADLYSALTRSEERRVGKECRL